METFWHRSFFDLRCQVVRLFRCILCIQHTILGQIDFQFAVWAVAPHPRRGTMPSTLFQKTAICFWLLLGLWKGVKCQTLTQDDRRLYCTSTRCHLTSTGNSLEKENPKKHAKFRRFGTPWSVPSGQAMPTQLSVMSLCCICLPCAFGGSAEAHASHPAP